MRVTFLFAAIAVMAGVEQTLAFPLGMHAPELSLRSIAQLFKRNRCGPWNGQTVIYYKQFGYVLASAWVLNGY
jgi:hypothetical protein